MPTLHFRGWRSSTFQAYSARIGACSLFILCASAIPVIGPPVPWSAVPAEWASTHQFDATLTPQKNASSCRRLTLGRRRGRPTWRLSGRKSPPPVAEVCFGEGRIKRVVRHYVTLAIKLH